MIQAEELINLILSVVFVFYLLYFVRTQSTKLKSFWFVGIVLIILSQVFTIAEGFLLSDFFNLAEHTSFSIATIFFLVSVVKRELY